MLCWGVCVLYLVPPVVGGVLRLLGVRGGVRGVPLGEGGGRCGELRWGREILLPLQMKA